MEPIVLPKIYTARQRLPRYSMLLISGHTMFSQPIQASSIDYGFDFDEDWLADELFSPLPACFEDRSIHQVGADEFDALYRWFNS